MAIYDAFISYSHSKDKPIAASLQSAVQKLGKPWYRRRALRVFRDDTSLSATPQLWPTIERALNDCCYFILLASPEAAASKWVNKEVAHWLEHHGIDTLLIGVTDGALAWDETAGDFTAGEGHPLPSALKGRFPAEPKWIDLTLYREGANPRDAKFTELAADFAAAIRGMPKEDLLSQEVRQQRRALRLAWSAAVLLLLLAGVAAWRSIVAIDNARIAQEQRGIAEKNEQDAIEQRQEADRQRDLAVKNEQRAQANEEKARQERDQALQSQSRFLAQEARQQTEGGNATGGMQFALEALRDEAGSDEIARTRPYVVDAERALYGALLARRELTVLQSTAIHAASFTSSGRRILAAANDDSIGLWDARSGRQMVQLTDGKPISGALFSPDERRILTWSRDDRSLRIWDVGTARVIARFGSAETPLEHVAFTPDGLVVAAGGTTARIWAQSGQEICVLRGHMEYEQIGFRPNPTPGGPAEQMKELRKDSITGAAVSGDGRLLLTTARDQTARIWDIAACRQIRVLEGHKNHVYGATISRDGHYAATTGNVVIEPGFAPTAMRQSDVRVWETMTGKEVARVRVEAWGPPKLALSPDRRFLVTAGFDVELWDVATSQRIASLPARTRVGQRVQYSSDGRLILATSEDGVARVLDARNLQQIGIYGKHPGAIYHASFSQDQTRILTVGGRSARIWSLDRPADGPDTLTADVADVEIDVPRTPSNPTGKVRRPGWLVQTAFSPDSKLVAASGMDQTVRIWSAASGKLVTSLKGTGITFSPDGRLAVLAGAPFAEVRDVATGRVLMQLRSRQGKVGHLAFRPDGKMIASSMLDNPASISLWDVTKGTESIWLGGHKGPIYSISWSPDGRDIMTSSFDGTIRIWTERTGERLVLQGHRGYVYDAAFTPDGKYIVSRGADQSLGIWDPTTGNRLATVSYPNEYAPNKVEFLHSFVVSPDGGHVAILSGSNIVIWSLDEMKEAAVLKADLPTGFRAMTFGADSTRIIALASSVDRSTIQVWDWKEKRLVASTPGPGDLAFNGLRVSPNRKLLAVLPNSDRSMALLPIFASTQALIDHAKATIPRCLSNLDQELSFVGSLSRWCEEHAIWPATRGRLGIQMSSLSDDAAAKLGITTTSGVIITLVQTSSAAEVSGLKPGDVLLAVNGQPVPDPKAAVALINAVETGKEMTLTILRDGKTKDVAAHAAETLLTPERHRGEAMAPIAARLPSQPTAAALFERLQAVERSQQILEDLIADDPHNPGLRHDLALVYDRLANAMVHAGNADGLLAAQAKALELRRKLVDDDPDNALWQQEVATTHETIGAQLNVLKRYEEALAAYRKALEVRRRLAEQHRDTLQRWEELVDVLDSIGDILRTAGRRAEALASFEEIRPIREKLANSEPGNGQRQRDLLILLNKIGDVLVEEKRTVEALDHYRRALALRAALAAAEPGNAQLRWNLSVSYSVIGGVLVKEKRHDEAVASFRECVAIREPLVAANPDNVTWQRAIASLYGRLGDALKAQKKLGEALDAYRKTLAVRERVAAGDADNKAWQRDVSLAWDDLADALEDDGKLDESLAAYRRSLVIGKNLIFFDPSNRQWQREVAVTYRNMGRVLAAKREFHEALRAYRDSLDIISRLIERYGSTAQWQGDRQRAISGIGGLGYKLVMASEFAMALQVSDEAISLAPDQTWLHSNRAHALMFLQRADEARAVYLAFRGKQKVERERSWETVILDDFAELRKAGLAHPLMDEIEKQFAARG